MPLLSLKQDGKVYPANSLITIIVLY